LHLPIVAILLAVAPIAAFLALRYPLIFPFGLYVALIPFDAILSVSSGATIVRLLGAFTGLALAVRILVLRRFVLPGPAWYIWVAYVAWAGVTILWTNDLPESQRIFTIFVQNLAVMTLIAIYPIEKRELKWLLGIAIAAGMGAGAYAIIKFQQTGGDLAEGRVSFTSGGLSVDPNYFATSFLLPLALALAVAIGTRNLFLKLSCWAAAAVMMVGVLLSGSRGGFIAVAIVFVYFAIRSRSRIQVAIISGACLALTVAYPKVWLRFLNDPERDGSGSGRTLIWHVGAQALRHTWLFGNGIGSFPETYARYFLSAYQHVSQGWHRPAHNVVLSSLVEVGIIGLALLVYAWYRSIKQLSVIPVSSSYYPLRIAVEATLFGLFAQALFIDPMWIKYYWLVFTMPFILLNVYAPRPVGRRVRALRAPAFGARAPVGG
jgi:O-antigen ligase